jgi:hypothetical protein
LQHLLRTERLIEDSQMRRFAQRHSAFCNPSLRLSKLYEKHTVAASQFEYVSTKW